MRGISTFIKSILGHQYFEIIADGPKPVIEEPVCGFGKRDAVRGMVAAALLELMDMGGVEGGLAVQCDHPVMR
jgi:hypothetical protein